MKKERGETFSSIIFARDDLLQLWVITTHESCIDKLAVGSNGPAGLEEILLKFFLEPSPNIHRQPKPTYSGDWLSIQRCALMHRSKYWAHGDRGDFTTSENIFKTDIAAREPNSGFHLVPPTTMGPHSMDPDPLGSYVGRWVEERAGETATWIYGAWKLFTLSSSKEDQHRLLCAPKSSWPYLSSRLISVPFYGNRYLEVRYFMKAQRWWWGGQSWWWCWWRWWVAQPHQKAKESGWTTSDKETKNTPRFLLGKLLLPSQPPPQFNFMAKSLSGPEKKPSAPLFQKKSLCNSLESFVYRTVCSGYLCSGKPPNRPLSPLQEDKVLSNDQI